MTKREAMEITHTENQLMELGIEREDCDKLRRISMTLRRWFELECGTDGGCIERDESTGRPYWHSAMNGHALKDSRTYVADREAGAKRRLAAIMAKYPTLTPYIQGDPRGCALYILTPEHLKGDHAIDSIYNRGIAIG